MPITSLNGHALYYEITGSGSEPLILFNGITMSTAAWTLMLPLLEAHYQLIRFDFIGQGQSDKPNCECYTLIEQADIAAALLTQCGIERVHLVGLSYGGIVAQHFAHRHPHRLKTLFLASTLAWSDHANRTISDSWVTADKVGGLDLRLAISLPWLYSSHYLALLDERRLAELKTFASFVNWPTVIRLINGIKYHDARTWLNEIITPTQVIVGNEDRLTPLYQSELLASSIPHATLEVLPNAGHVLHIEAPDTFAHSIIRFCQPHH